MAVLAFEELVPQHNKPMLAEFLNDIEFLRELAEGEITVQTLFMAKQTLQRLGHQVKALRPEGSNL